MALAKHEQLTHQRDDKNSSSQEVIVVVVAGNSCRLRLGNMPFVPALFLVVQFQKLPTLVIKLSWSHRDDHMIYREVVIKRGGK